MTINNAITRLRALAARVGDPERRELLELADGLEAAVGVLERGARDIASGRLPACANCRTAAGGGLTCPDCGRWFCDNCYDTGLGDNCYDTGRARRTCRPTGGSTTASTPRSWGIDVSDTYYDGYLVRRRESGGVVTFNALYATRELAARAVAADAEELGISANQARKLIRTGEIHGVKLGKYLRTTWDDVRHYIEKSRTDANGKGRA